MTERNKRLRKNMILLLISLALMVALIIVAIVGFLNAGIIMSAIGFLGFCVFLGVTFGFWVYRKSIKRSYCPCCGTHYNYENDISWEETERYTKDTAKTSRDIAKIEFECHCPKCHQTQIFKQTFTLYEMNLETGKQKAYNLRDSAKKYFV